MKPPIKPLLLVIEDDPQIRRFLRAALAAIKVDQGLNVAALADQMRGISPADVRFMTVPISDYNYQTPTGQLALLCEYAAPLLAIGGTLVAWKGDVPAAERTSAEQACAVLGLEPAGAVRTIATRAYAEMLQRRQNSAHVSEPR